MKFQDQIQLAMEPCIHFCLKYTLELRCKQASSRIIPTTAMFADLDGSHQVSLGVVGIPIHGWQTDVSSQLTSHVGKYCATNTVDAFFLMKITAADAFFKNRSH